jgi:lysozyme
MNIKRLKETLIRHEGLRLKPYYCTAKKLSIGIGRNLDDVGISKEEALTMLDNDIKNIVEQIKDRFPWFDSLSPVRQEVIVNMCFNLGINGFSKFKNTIHFLETSQFKQAAIEMLESLWADQVGNRAKELSKMMLEG